MIAWLIRNLRQRESGARHRTRRSRQRGLGVLELVIACSLFLVLTTVLLSIFFRGVQAWRQVDERSSLHTRGHKVIDDFRRDLESSSASTAEFDDSEQATLAFASPFLPRSTGEAEKFTVDPVSGAVRWSKYLVIYYHPASQEIRRRELEVPPGSPAAASLLPLSEVDLGDGLNPMSFYATDGQTLAAQVETFSVSRQARSLELRLRLFEKDRKVTTHTSVLLRN